jgi:molybdopterin-containing oxidoreductase family membrane subunit
LLLGFVHLLIASDLALSLVPGWHSAVIPAYQIVSAYEAAVALVVVGLAVVARLEPAEASEGPDAFQPCAKLLLALGLLWFYFVWCELLTYWYGRTPDEQSLLGLFMFGPGAGLFLVSALGNFVVPLIVLLWHRARTSRRVTTAVASAVLIGSFADRLRLYLGAWTVATRLPEEHLPESLLPLPLPGLAEAAACLGILAAVGLVVLLALRRFAPVARWEVEAVERLTPERRLLRARVPVVGRPT